MESWLQSWRPRTIAFCNFCCPPVVMPGHTKCCTCHNIILANLQIWCSKISGNQRPDLLTSLMNMSFVLRLPRKMHLCRSSSPHACHRFWKCYKTLTFCSLLKRCTIPCACHAKRDLNVQKWSVRGVFCTCWLHILTSKYASRHKGVHFFDIATAKSGPSMVCFVHFDFQMCFAPQRRALFRHRNCQKWSEPGVFCTFWLRNVLRATTACNFSSLIWPDGSAPAALASLLFDFSTLRSHKSLEKHNVSRLSYLFAHLRLLSSDSFSSLIFSLLLFSSLWLFPSLLFICPYCRKFDF